MIEARRGTETPTWAGVESTASRLASNPTPVNLSSEEGQSSTTTPPAGSDLVSDGIQVAQGAPDTRAPLEVPRRGVSPPTEPPSNDLELEKAFEAWRGVKVTLPNGQGIDDPKSPTGYVMGPFNDLKNVAEAGKRERLNAMIGPAETLRRYLGQGGVFDYQRRSYKYGKDGFTQLRQFRNIANINVVLFAQKLGLPLWVTLKIAGEYARENSSNARSDQPFNLDPQTMDYIVIGYHLGDDGLIE